MATLDLELCPLHFRRTNVTFVVCNLGCLFFLFYGLFFLFYEMQSSASCGCARTISLNRTTEVIAGAEDLVEWCFSTRTRSVDVCMESLNEKKKNPGTESPCPENKPGDERIHYLRCETCSEVCHHLSS